MTSSGTSGIASLSGGQYQMSTGLATEQNEYEKFRRHVVAQEEKRKREENERRVREGLPLLEDEKKSFWKRVFGRSRSSSPSLGSAEEAPVVEESFAEREARKKAEKAKAKEKARETEVVR